MSDETDRIHALLYSTNNVDPEHSHDAVEAKIAAAIKAGITVQDIEWNQRMGRDLFTVGSAGDMTARVKFYTDNGLSEADAKVAAK